MKALSLGNVHVSHLSWLRLLALYVLLPPEPILAFEARVCYGSFAAGRFGRFIPVVPAGQMLTHIRTAS
jgi:hypothetical protein